VATGKYFYPTTREELVLSLKDPSIITEILTIEGIHSLGSDTEPEETIIDRINKIKNDWEVPVFFITFSHHFDNGLCGHAHSFPDLPSRLFLNQQKGMNASFTEKGLRITRHLLAINEDGTSTGNSYRILLDVKHMSARSRRDYYNKIILPALEKNNIIPVIASHIGYSNIQSLNALIDNEINEHDKKVFGDGFLPWNINLCYEDLKIILRTKGIVGLNFDQRILGVPSRKKERKDNSIKTIWRNLEAMVRALQNDPDLNKEEKEGIWDIFCLGTDFDGYIDPINDFPTALEFDLFAIQLTEEVKKEEYISLLYDHSTEEIVKKICFENLKEFTIRNFPSKMIS
jgi:hypothetical protein